VYTRQLGTYTVLGRRYSHRGDCTVPCKAYLYTENGERPSTSTSTSTPSTSASQHAVESLAIQGGPKFGGSSERRKSSVIEPVNEKYLGSSAYTAFMNGRLHTRDGPRAPTTGTTEGVYDAHRPCHTHTAPYHMCRARQGLSLCVCENCQHGALGLDIVL
jgi:hypothetical protein